MSTEASTTSLCDCRIAFSIHGSNCFIVATKRLDIENLPIGMNIVKSRNPDATGIKLVWDKLKNEEGNPTDNKNKVLLCFEELETNGWKVDYGDFVKTHWQ